MACVRRNSNFCMTQKNVVGRWHRLSLVRNTLPHKQTHAGYMQERDQSQPAPLLLQIKFGTGAHTFLRLQNWARIIKFFHHPHPF